MKRPTSREGRRRLVELRAILKIRATKRKARAVAEQEIAELLTPKNRSGEGTAEQSS